jgi:ribosomal protein L16 Arg81 hydroxylase
MGSSSFMDSVTSQSESDVSDQELTRFGVALIDIQEIQSEATQHIHTAIEEASISGERLDEIFLLQRENPEQLEKEASSEEIEEFSQVMGEITQIYQSTEIKIVDSLKEKSYDIESFNQMATKIEKDPELLNRLQTLFNGQQEDI